MTYLISGILIVFNYFSTLFKNNSRMIKLLLLTLMWVLFWGNYGNADYNNYVVHYNYIIQTGESLSSNQFGFALLMKIAIFFGLSYNYFLMIVSTIGLFLIVSTVEKYAAKPQFVYILYFIHPFLLDIVQVKHFLAMAIVVFCFRYVKRDGFKNAMKFVIGIVIASSVHYVALIFLPLLVIKNIKFKHLYRLIFLYLLIAIPMAFTSIFQRMASYIFPTQGLDTFFNNRARLGFLVQFCIQGAILLMILYSKRFLERYKGDNKIVALIYKANVFLLILFPFYIINGNFERAFRMLYIPNYIVFSMVFVKMKEDDRKLLWGILLSITIMLFILYVFRSSSDTVFFPVFENNLVMK